ncbi:MAG TPA: hypothetical protein VFM19_00640 [Candidatus Limnocylindria bacterium]|nr:hypothetical protein [Candidatus Limnocylindria bacterium]
MARTRDRGRPAVFRRVERDATPHDRTLRARLRHGTELEPDPRFARRLRGIVLSRHVAVREGHVVPSARRAMTPIGRGVLVSSVLLALGVTGVGAYSQSALPDDVLYPIKLRLEQLRIAIAPAEMRDDLLALALEERAVELARAADAGRWNAAEEAAWRLAVTESELVALDSLTPAVAARVAAHLHALDQVLAHAPEHAAATVAERLDPARADLRRLARGVTGAPTGVPARRGPAADPASPAGERPPAAPGRSTRPSPSPRGAAGEPATNRASDND